MSAPDQPPTQYHHHGRFRVAGGSLPDAVTAYRTYGDISNPCIVFPTCFGAKLDSENFLKRTFERSRFNFVYRSDLYGRGRQGKINPATLALERLTSLIGYGP